MLKALKNFIEFIKNIFFKNDTQLKIAEKEEELNRAEFKGLIYKYYIKLINIENCKIYSKIFERIILPLQKLFGIYHYKNFEDINSIVYAVFSNEIINNMFNINVSFSDKGEFITNDEKIIPIDKQKYLEDMNANNMVKIELEKRVQQIKKQINAKSVYYFRKQVCCDISYDIFKIINHTKNNTLTEKILSEIIESIVRSFEKNGLRIMYYEELNNEERDKFLTQSIDEISYPAIYKDENIYADLNGCIVQKGYINNGKVI